MKFISTYVALSIALVTFVAGIIFGYYFTPEYQGQMYAKDEMNTASPADYWTDLRYLNAMTAHHIGAMLLAKQAEKNSKRPEIIALAKEIQKNEPVLIDELYQWKRDWYKDTKKVREPRVAQLGSYDKTFDLRFLNALIAHHEAGVKMTRDIRLKSSRAEVLNNADAVEQFLLTSAVQLRKWRSDWYDITY